MSFWSSETLKKRVPREGLIDPYEEGRVMRGAYELSVGAQAYITSKNGERTKLGDGERIVIPPGQFLLVLILECLLPFRLRRRQFLRLILLDRLLQFLVFFLVSDHRRLHAFLVAGNGRRDFHFDIAVEEREHLIILALR